MLGDLQENRTTIEGPMVILPAIGTMVNPSGCSEMAASTAEAARSVAEASVTRQEDRSVIEARSGQKIQSNQGSLGR